MARFNRTHPGNNEKYRMKSYQWVLFDADDTLFHFDSFSGLRLMFAGFGIDFTARYYQDYQAVNKLLWVDYQNGHIDAQHLQQKRFAPWVDTLQVAA